MKPIQNDPPASVGLEDCDSRIFPLRDKMGKKAEGFITQSVACFLLKPVSSSK